jgi:phosphinothricin acetyltransferase
MTPDDWPDVCRIYEEGLATGVGSFETAAPSWEQWNVGRLAHSRLVARGPAVIGWAALSLVSPRACYAGVAEFGIYVAAAVRGQGVGRRLLEALIHSAERNGIWTLQGVTDSRNTASVALHLAKLQQRLPARFDWRQTGSQVLRCLHGDVFFDFGPQDFFVPRRRHP